MANVTRREFMQAAAVGVAVASQGPGQSALATEEAAPGDRPRQDDSVTVLNPGNRVPVSLIIDDSTCLVNLAHFGIPQWGEVLPRLLRPWRHLPREIPDTFVRTFVEWCHEQGIKGKFSVVPYPACVGWLDRFLPGWTKQELEDSLELVRTLVTPDWDIHPEMVSHTRVIDTRTGRPYPEPSEHFMENWRWTDDKSTDQVAEYMAYALRILKNVGMPCEGITTPGGFGNRVRPALAQATLESCREVFQAEIPHYFRHTFTGDQSVAPRVEYASGLDGPDPRCVVSIIACTEDWFGGWDGMSPGSVDQFIMEDLQGGRLPEVIGRGEPAIMLCHWPGIYYNGEEKGFAIFKEIVRRLDAAYDRLTWMKLSEISRYWAAKELTRIERHGDAVTFWAPYACPRFTVRIAGRPGLQPRLVVQGVENTLRHADMALDLDSGSWHSDDNGVVLCFDLPKGESQVKLTMT